MSKNTKNGQRKSIPVWVLLLLLILYLVAQKYMDQDPTLQTDPTAAHTIATTQVTVQQTKPTAEPFTLDLDQIPEFDEEPFVVLNDNQPLFEKADITTKAYEYFSELDELGRCGYVMACVGQELMPTEPRESISHVKPTGWVQNQYDFVDGKSLYNRCHLIGFQLTGENANKCNLITGTRYMNTEGMLPFENMVADYVKETGNHVLYRVTPIYDGDDLVASGVQLEAWSVEDDGEGIGFHVYVYNNQPGVIIDYATGENRAK